MKKYKYIIFALCFTGLITCTASAMDGMDLSGLDMTSPSQGMDMNSFNDMSSQSLNIDGLSARMKDADTWFSQSMGSSYSGMDSNIFGLEMPDLNFESLNTQFAEMQIEFNNNKTTLDTEIKLPDFNNYNGNARNAFDGTFGDITESLAVKSFKIPSDFDSTSALKSITDQKNNAYAGFTGSDIYTTVKRNLSIGDVFKKASSGLSMPDINTSKLGKLYNSAESMRPHPEKQYDNAAANLTGGSSSSGTSHAAPSSDPSHLDLITGTGSSLVNGIMDNIWGGKK